MAKGKGKGGRPSILNQELGELICDAMRRGNYLETAAAMAGVDVQSVRNWLRRGRREPNSIYEAFAKLFIRSSAEAEDDALKKIAADQSWQSAAWRLERRYPKRWGRKAIEVIQGKPEAPESIEAVLEEIKEAEAANGSSK